VSRAQGIHIRTKSSRKSHARDIGRPRNFV